MTKKNNSTVHHPRVILEWKNIPTLDIFYSLIATKLNFPESFGRSFDTLTECLRDCGKASITIYHRNDFLRKEAPEDKVILEKICNDIESVKWIKK